MCDENTSIHEFDYTLISDIIRAWNVNGPGSPEVTVRALSFIDNLNNASKIADIGCGTAARRWCWPIIRQGISQASTCLPALSTSSMHKQPERNIQDRVKGICRLYGQPCLSEGGTGSGLVGRGHLQHRV